MFNIGDKVKSSYGIGTIVEISGKFAKVKFENQEIPLNMHIDYIKILPQFKIGQLLKYKNS